MEKMAEQLRQTYKAMETEELLYLRARGTLTETATTVLEEVLKVRNLDEHEVEAAEAEFKRELSAEKLINENIASIPRRLVANIIDVGGIALLLGVVFNFYLLFFPHHQNSAPGVCGLLGFVYIFFKDGVNGQSIGKRAVNIRVVRINSDRPCSWLASFVRNITGCLGALDWIFAVGPDCRRLGDIFAGTRVVNAFAQLDTRG